MQRTEGHGGRFQRWQARLARLAGLCMPVIGLLDAAPAQAKVEFAGPIRWLDYQQGLKAASGHKKNVLLFLHTDSCPKCTLQGESFKTNRDLQKLAKDLIMVEVNGGTAPMDVVNRYARFGNYYPRIVFLQSDGTPMDSIISANPSFPYYFQPSRPEVLIEAMKKAIATHTASGAKSPAHHAKG